MDVLNIVRASCKECLSSIVAARVWMILQVANRSLLHYLVTTRIVLQAAVMIRRSLLVNKY